MLIRRRVFLISGWMKGIVISIVKEELTGPWRIIDYSIVLLCTGRLRNEGYVLTAEYQPVRIRSG